MPICAQYLCQPSCACPGHLHRGSRLASIQLERLASGGGLAAFQPSQEGLLRTRVLHPWEDMSVKADWYSLSSPQQAVCAPACHCVEGLPLSSGKRLVLTCGVQGHEVSQTDGWNLGCTQSFITCVICAPGVAGARAGQH